MKYSLKAFFKKGNQYVVLELCAIFLITSEYRSVLTSFFSDLQLVAFLPFLL